MSTEPAPGYDPNHDLIRQALGGDLSADPGGGHRGVDTSLIDAALGGDQIHSDANRHAGEPSHESMAAVGAIEERLAANVRGGLEHGFAPNRVETVTQSLESAGKFTEDLRTEIPSARRAAEGIRKVVYAGGDSIDSAGRAEAGDLMRVVDSFTGAYHLNLPKVREDYKDAETGARPLFDSLVEARHDSGSAGTKLEEVAPTTNPADSKYVAARQRDIQGLIGLVDMYGSACAAVQDQLNLAEPTNQLSRMIDENDLVAAAEAVRRVIHGLGQDSHFEEARARMAVNELCSQLDGVEVGLATIGAEQTQVRDKIVALADGVRDMLSTSPVLNR